ncbi:tetraacyldisaccharide 4'-kinase [Thermomonas fusca]|uniref:Tetraacyldisaccharide 4'-kinase n=1 Tax=Thermomonas fusca TaxID=215690 RepID=A0A5R9PEZ5_9GAMM|nr:tetraacyldisaccharide 4'-kinase [Thermomonas fusca]TLX21318.1 tetraacyldisaccharide 4'-kinase [Thermomonas fusca]
MSRPRLPQTPAWWFDGSTPPLWARAIAPLYAGAVALRRLAYRRGLLRPRQAGVPVVVVGNLIAGGSGKTPLVLAVVERLRAAGWTPGVASRGYGREDAATPRWVEAGMDAALCGDEPLLISHASGAKVRVDRDRAAAAIALAAAGCDIVVCDDGLQHYRLARDIEIEVQDARRRYGNGLLLPAGPLREPLERAADCALRVLNLGVAADDAAAACAGEWPMRLGIGELRPLVGGRGLPLAAFAGQRVHAVAGIGEPERFFSMLRDAGIGVVPHAFPDHHVYTPADFEFGSQLPVLMTEKDAVKCMAFVQPGWHAVPVAAQLPEAFWQALLGRLPQPLP